MANPTFDSTSLTTDAAREIFVPPVNRATAESVPDVAGAYVQPHPRGPRRFRVSGIYKGSAQSSAALADSTLKTTLREIQAKVSTVGVFVGVDAATYNNCVLESYEHGEIQVIPHGTNQYKAITAVNATIMDTLG